MGPAHDQGQTFECVAYAASGMKRYHEFRQSKAFLEFDTAGLFQACKAVDGHPNARGTFIRVAMKVLNESGMAANDGQMYRIGGYARVRAVDEIRHALFEGGPVVIGVLIDQNELGPLAPPYVASAPSSPTGGHAMLIVGYDDGLEAFRVRNSWGPFWGECGHCWIPYSYLLKDPMFDAWTAVDES
jgi:C1A family cysteine protease